MPNIMNRNAGNNNQPDNTPTTSGKLSAEDEQTHQRAIAGSSPVTAAGDKTVDEVKAGNKRNAGGVAAG